MRACGIAPDPFQLTAYTATFGTDYTNTSGKTVVSPPGLVGGEDTGTFLIISESTLCNGPGVGAPSAYTPTNAAEVQQVSIYDGVCYRYVDPALGVVGTTGGVIGRLGDKLIDATKYERFVAVNLANSSSTISDWANGLISHRWAVGILRARAAGLPITGVIVCVGINDGIAGTSQANWQARFETLRAGLRGMNCNAPISVVVTSRTDASTVSSAVAAAQAAVVSAPNNVIAGPSLNSLSGANLLADGIHLSGTGQDAFAELLKDHIVADF